MRYRAFISYSHRDEAFVRWLHRRIEGWAIPSGLIGRQTRFGPVPDRLRPIFRDRDDFSGGNSLKAATMAALEESDALIVVCSPNSAKSPHVDSEIHQFKQLGRAARVVPIIISGEPGHPEYNCFPPALLRDPDPEDPTRTISVEPIAADARDQGDGRQRAAAKVVAGLLDLPFDEIVRRDEKNRRTRVAGWSGAAVGAFVFATALSSYALYNAYQVSVTIDKGVSAIGAMVRETVGYNLEQAQRDEAIATQCDLMDSLAADRRDLAGPQEEAICFLNRTLAAEDLRGPTATTRMLCDWRDSKWRLVSGDRAPKADQASAAAFALEETFNRIAKTPETASECAPRKGADLDAHADYLFEKLDELARRRPDRDDLRVSHDNAAWEVISRHEARRDWAGSDRIMQQAAALRLIQAQGSLESEAVQYALIDRAVYLRRLAWLHYQWLEDPAGSVSFADAAVEIWARLATLPQPVVEGHAVQAVSAHNVKCLALNANDRKAEALTACEAARSMLERYLNPGSRVPESARAELEALRSEIERSLSLVRQVNAP